MRNRLFRMTFIMFLIISISTMYTTAHARSINDAVGRTSFTWLKAVSDAGISAAGECLAARDGVTSLLVHPAAVAGINTGVVKLSYASHYVDTQYGSIGYAGKIKEKFLGIRLTYINYGEFVRTDDTGKAINTFTAGDMGLTLNIGKKVRDDLKIGMMVSYLNSTLDNFTSQAFVLDIGIIAYPPFDGLTVGAVLMNLGKVTKSYSSGYTDTLPVVLSVGARKKLQHSPFTLFADVVFPNDNDITYALGLEASIHDMLFLYAGTKSRSVIDIQTRKAETDYSGIITFGFGLTLKHYRFNYAYYPDNTFEDIHKITFSLMVP